MKMTVMSMSMVLLMLMVMVMNLSMLLLIMMVGTIVSMRYLFCREATDESGEGSALCGLGEVKKFIKFKKLKSSDISCVALFPAKK